MQVIFCLTIVWSFLSYVKSECDETEGFFFNENGTCEWKRWIGEPCKGDNYCKNDKYIKLTCNNGICSCDPFISIFDKSTKMCRTKAGSSCAENRNCVNNSHCNDIRNRRGFDRHSRIEEVIQSVCECDPEYLKTPVGTCEPPRKYGEPCNKDASCVEGLKCSSSSPESGGTCECDTGKFFDMAKKSCVNLANQTCENWESCITNSECRWVSDLTGARNLCSCMDGYEVSVNGTCIGVRPGPTCSTDWTQNCNKERGLICKDGNCQCKYDHFQEFDEELKKCKSKVNGPCDDSIPCVSNSFCGNIEENGMQKRCLCKENFIEVNGQCLLTIGQSCDYNNENLERCDSFAPLFCIEGTCQCDFQKVYDKESKTCRGLVGANCHEIKSPCVNGAFCERQRRVAKDGENSSFYSGICKCKKGWKVSKEGLCTLKQNTSILHNPDQNPKKDVAYKSVRFSHEESVDPLDVEQPAFD